MSDVARDAAKNASSVISDPNNMAKIITGAAATQAKINETFQDPQSVSSTVTEAQWAATKTNWKKILNELLKAKSHEEMLTYATTRRL